MQERAFERVQTRIRVRLFCGFMYFTGIVTNLSENGMCIHSSVCLPSESKFEVIINYRNKVIKTIVKVSRTVETGGYYDIMGVALLNLHSDYLEFVDGLRLVRKLPF